MHVKRGRGLSDPSCLAWVGPDQGLALSGGNRGKSGGEREREIEGERERETGKGRETVEVEVERWWWWWWWWWREE